MFLDRRTFLAAGTTLLAASRVQATGAPRLGIIIHSFALKPAERGKDLRDPFVFLEHCRELGAAGIQTALGIRDKTYAERLRSQAQTHGMYLEASVTLPRQASEVERFEAEIQTAAACGARVARTVLLSGRRYEVFESAEAFQSFEAGARRSLGWAKPIVERHRVQLAVENHKDFEAAALAGLIRDINSPWVGVCLDFGNNIALLENPLETAEILAPLAFSTHVKDMSVEAASDGFLLSEVPLGTGFLDLGKIVRMVTKAHPETRFNLEMMTRDPLRIPCLSEKYWATLGHVAAPRLARMLAFVKKMDRRLPRVSGLDVAGRKRAEDDNVAACLRARWTD